MIGVKQLIELVGWLKKYDHIEIHGLEGSEGWFRFALHIVDPFIQDELEDLKETLSRDGWKFSHTYRDTDDNIHAVFLKEVNLDEYGSIDTAFSGLRYQKVLISMAYVFPIKRLFRFY